METNWAAENLQTIRTLMERSALYRRALAPITTFCGVVGIVAGIVGWQLKVNSDRGFVLFWNGVAVATLSGSFLLVRRQALKDSEPFWSPPTRRVAQAMLPPLGIGMFVGVVIVFGFQANDASLHNGLTMIWAWLYGCALHAAGFSISRGIRVLGWIYIAVGCVLLMNLTCSEQIPLQPHLLMAGIFGGLHLASGIYLYFTERRKNAS
jgi:hypothetical protein